MQGLLHPKPISLLRVMWDSGLFLNCNVYWNCPTNCRYCFSMLNRKSHGTVGKTATDKALGTLVSIINTVHSSRYNDRDPLQFFLREGYPVMVSNNSDPLSSLEVEHGYTKQYLEVLAENGNPVNLLSKWQGWADLDQDAYIETFQRNPRLWCSITITADNDDSLHKWEPGAPGLEQRLAIVKQLTDAGIMVDVRVIPFIFGDGFPNGDWDDPETYRPFIQRVKEAGAFAVSMSPLDFSCYDAQSVDDVCKQWVADNEWNRSRADIKWRYYSPDLSMIEEVSRIWHAEVTAAGMNCGVHQSVHSLVSDGTDLSAAVNAPPWHDLSLSWVKAAHRLKQAQRDLGAPIVTTSAMIAEYITRGHKHADHRFDWAKLRDIVPHPQTNQVYPVKVLHETEGGTLADVIQLQTDDIVGWADCIFSDIATAPATLMQGSGGQIRDDLEGVLISYDADNPRESWAACRTQQGWDGRTVEELRGALLVNGQSPWDETMTSEVSEDA